MKRTILVFIFLSSCYCQSRAGNRDSLNRVYPNDSLFSFRSAKGYIPMLLHNYGEQATAPLHFSKNQWCMIGAGTLATGILIMNDQAVDNRVTHLGEDHHWIGTCSPQITRLGDDYAAALMVGIGGYSLLFKDNKALHTTLLATQAMLTAGTWTRFIKLMTGRERPSISYWYPNHEGGYWHGPFAQYLSDKWDEQPQSGFDAFPSGHTCTVFSMATVFAMQYKEKPAIPIIAYTAATAVSITRLIEHTHWVSDIFVGGCIGYFCGKQVVKHYNKVYHPDEATTLKSNKRKIESEYSFDMYNGILMGKYSVRF